MRTSHLSKGQHTRQSILESGMEFVCRYGFTALSIGEVAKRLNMSRTGIISHFNNKSDMQIAILRHCEEVFIQQVIKPSFSSDALERLNNHFSRWVNWVFVFSNQTHMSCPFVKAVAEYQDRPDSEVRDVVAEQQARTLDYLASLVSLCKEQGAFTADADPQAFAAQAYGIYLTHNVSKNLLKDSTADARFHHQIEALVKANTHKE